MGLQMVFAVAPLCKLTPERKERMQALINTLDIEEFEEDSFPFYAQTLTDARETLMKYVVEVCRNYDAAARDVGYLRLDTMNYLLGITGAPSHGDPPTDSYDAFNAVECIEQVFDQLEEWAIEDYMDKGNFDENNS